MAFLASPRVRRRLAWITVILGGAGLLALVGVLLPSHGGPQAKPGAPSLTSTEPGETLPLLGSGPDAATERARTKAVATVRPLATRFVTAMIRRRDLAAAHSLLIPELRSRYSLSDWQAGRHLPLSSVPKASLIPAASVAFSGPKLVGLVMSFARQSTGSSGSILLAIRLRKVNRRWLIDYLREGNVSRSISETNFSPAGFSPGSQSTSLSAWLPLLLGFVGLIVLVALVDRGLSRRRRPRG
jgi:hypothetical protein